MPKCTKSRKRLTRNDWALLAAAIFCLIRGGSYIDLTTTADVTPLGISLVSQVFGLYFWVIVWIGVGLYSLWTFLCSKSVKHNAWGAVAGMLIGWGAAYALGLAFVDDGYSRELFVRDIVRSAEYLMTGIAIGLLSRNDLEAVHNNDRVC